MSVESRWRDQEHQEWRRRNPKLANSALLVGMALPIVALIAVVTFVLWLVR